MRRIRRNEQKNIQRLIFNMGKQNMTFLDRLMESFPWLKTFIDYAEQYGGPVMAISFFFFMLLIFYWIFVVVPKRVQLLFDKLSRKGYADVDPAESGLALIVEKLAPIYDHHPRKGYPIPPWKIIKAISDSHKRGTRYFIYASRLQIESSGSGPGNANSLRHCVMVLEKRKFEFPEAVYLKPADSAGGHKTCDSRYNLKKAVPENKSPFFDKYAFFTKSGSMAVFPDTLRETLTSLLSLFVIQKISAVQIWGVNLKFSQEGWGLLSSEQIYKPEAMDKFMEAADLISDSLCS